MTYYRVYLQATSETIVVVELPANLASDDVIDVAVERALDVAPRDLCVYCTGLAVPQLTWTRELDELEPVAITTWDDLTLWTASDR